MQKKLLNKIADNPKISDKTKISEVIDNKNMEHEEYLKRRDELVKIRDDSMEGFDKTILTLSTGALILSITFLDRIGRPFNPLTFWIITISWVFFGLSLIVNIISFVFARWNMDLKIKDLNERYKAKTTENNEKKFWQRKATNICNYLTLICFLTGVILFSIYVITVQKNNLDQVKKTEKIMSEEKQSPKTETDTTVPEKDRIIEGKTEPEAAILIDPLTKAKTEPPQAVAKPQTEKPKPKK